MNSLWRTPITTIDCVRTLGLNGWILMKYATRLALSASGVWAIQLAKFPPGSTALTSLPALFTELCHAMLFAKSTASKDAV